MTRCPRCDGQTETLYTLPEDSLREGLETGGGAVAATRGKVCRICRNEVREG